MSGIFVESFNVRNVRPDIRFIRETDANKDDHVKQVVKQAHEELLQLMHQRSALMKRIAAAKETITGLARLFGEDVLSSEVQELVADQNARIRQRGFTRTCRMILMEAQRPLSAREVCEKLREKTPDVLARHKDLAASVTTVLNRLASYGEAEAVVLPHGRRTWRWISPAS